MDLKFGRASQRFDGLKFGHAFQRSDGLILDVLPNGSMELEFGHASERAFIPMCVGFHTSTCKINIFN